MVRYPDGRCPNCGERLFARIDGPARCSNCTFRSEFGRRT